MINQSSKFPKTSLTKTSFLRLMEIGISGGSGRLTLGGKPQGL